MALRGIVEVLQREGISPYLINHIISVALTDTTTIRWGKDLLRTIIRGQGVRQGCPFSPRLFIFVLHWIIRQVVQRCPAFSLDLLNETILPACLAFADDLLLMATSMEAIEEFVRELIPLLQRFTMEINFSESELLVRQPGHTGEGLPRQVRIAGHLFQQVRRIVCLGAVIGEGLDRQPMVHQRIRRAQRGAAALLPTFHRHPLPVRLVYKLYRTIISPALSYELCTAASTVRSRATLQRESAVLLNGLLGTARGGTPALTPQELGESSLARAVCRARIRYYGHIIRRPQGHILKSAFHLRLGWLMQGRPCFTYKDSLKRDLRRFPRPAEGWRRLLRSKAAASLHLQRAPFLDQQEEEEGTEVEGDV
ncbi:hypothetical protein ONE63_007303 [Megalurothrips usitatus]|uniref:Reverse transcriptase domain-containing protein n=1 Tax=Megalurothrips usitatus TaxID=439358 RepID=A0AAV7XVS7_9NEOP|nr:hypothetical protein ONE63_007303 [Megalurothrips usitatus]